jgi:hypothetical protein
MEMESTVGGSPGMSNGDKVSKYELHMNVWYMRHVVNSEKRGLNSIWLKAGLTEHAQVITFVLLRDQSSKKTLNPQRYVCKPVPRVHVGRFLKSA